MKRIPIVFGNEYEMSDQIPAEETKRIRVSDEIVKGFKDLVDKHKPYQNILSQIEELEKKNEAMEDKSINEIIGEKIKSLNETKKWYERIRNRALDLSFFPYSEEKGNAISEIKIIEGKNALFQDVFGKDARIDGIIQTAEMGRGMGIRVENDKYEIHVVNPLKRIKVSIKYID